MKQLIYTSSASSGLGAKALAKIMASAQSNNEMSGVTGLLMYHDGTFIQLLEGEASAVDATFSRIRADRRHLRVLKLREQEGQDRLFPDWAMALARPDPTLEASGRGLKSFDKVIATLSSLRDGETDPRVLQLLHAFVEGAETAIE